MYHLTKRILAEQGYERIEINKLIPVYGVLAWVVMVAYCDRCNVKKIAVASMVMKVHLSLLIAFSPLCIPDT